MRGQWRRRRASATLVTMSRGKARRAGDEVQMVTAQGFTVRVAVRAGDPGWPPLLLCNGIGASLELLQPFVDALGPQREIIRFDLPGIGGSPLPLLPYHLSSLPPLLAGVLDHLGQAQADVLGISWGGGLAQQFALSRPERVRRLVLVATGTGSLMVPGQPSVLWHMLSPRRHLDPAHAADLAGDIYGGSMRATPIRAAELLGAAALAGTRRGYYYQLLAGAGWTSLPLLPLLRQPTLVLAGDDDPLIPLINARIMHTLIRGSQLHVYRGGHLDLVAEPHRLAPVVEQFLGPGQAAAATAGRASA
jgi:poly(3-hydroxyalkanoate) depolymerase